ncbi:mannose-1-phosphate guanyltransferase [Planosporangium mesophilum]|uniref:mannose-1-phosphate guanylyltransferase n=1 Tax=Planosporangium mesophilum TaxID=689768 RepID=A0A8J3TDJ3_9ACTN|nr:sugar phosphate nucleotidyltransferase [Planosporangium mesophilum]GII23536.1 mannose-1-phosphate guanyltransferase [Planosporangium mesophilum]
MVGVFYAVIPAGGSGTRLWPLSRAGHPKFLHTLTGTSASLLQATVDRLGQLAEPESTYVVTGVAHAAAVARQLPALPDANILVEPSPRDSCAAIGLAAAIIAARDPHAVMGSFAADHLVRDGDAFASAVRAATDGARDGLLMTVGITPTHPETGYGYLRCGEAVGAGQVRRVAEFTEKPPYEVAVSYVESGEYFWNASMFIWRVDVFLAELLRQQPQLHAGLMRIAHAWNGVDRERVLGEVWPTLPKISVDYAVMEGAAAAGLVGTVPGDFGWNDVGDFHTLGDVLERDERGNVVIESDDGAVGKSDILLHDTDRTVVVPRSGRLVSAVGVHDLIIVDTPDALLVCPRDRAQDVKKLVDSLKERGNPHV